MNVSTKEILRQICTGGPCPQTNVRTTTHASTTQTTSELIGQIIRPGGVTAPAGSAAAPAPVQSPPGA